MREFLSVLRKSNIHLKLVDGQLTIKYPKGKIDKELLEEIKFRKQYLLSYLKEFSKYEHLSIPVAKTQANYQLSSAQKRLWIISQLKEGNIAYNMSGIYFFEGTMDKTALERAFVSLIERHEILRTVFKEDESGEVRQFIQSSEDINFSITYQDLHNEKAHEKLIDTTIQEQLGKPFDLALGPLLRTSLMKLSDTKWIFVYVMHHIISDGWSMDVLIREILLLYNAYTKGEPHPLQPLRIQYKDYTAWQQEHVGRETLNLHKEYWLKQFEGELPVLQLPTYKPRPVLKTYNGGAIINRINSRLSKGLNELCREQDSTLFMGLLAIVNTLLYQYTNQEDIVIGTPIAGREHIDLEDQIGFYVNTLALRTRFKGTDNYKELLARTKEVMLGAYEHQLFPFDELNLQRDMSRSAVFDVMVVLQNATSGKTKEQYLGALKVTGYEIREYTTSKFDMTFNFVEIGEEIGIRIEYNSDIFDKEFVGQLGRHLNQLVESIVEQPDYVIQQLDYLCMEEKKLLLEFNNYTTDYPQYKTIVDLFEEQVEKTPDGIAIIYEETELTYRELNEQSNKFGNYLRDQYNIKADTLIGIKLKRSELMIITMLGILKAGGAYLPIDQDYPQERISYMLEDSKCEIVIDDEELQKFRKTEKKYAITRQQKQSKVTDLAYVIYTSGSTGRPKGVMIEHRNVTAFINWCGEEFGKSNFDIIFATTSICFDLSVFEIFYAITSGKKLRILTNAFFIPQYLHKHHNILINTVPSVVGTLLGEKVDFSPVSILNMAGEPIPKKYIDKLDFQNIEIRNLYGPSEDTTYSTVYRIRDKNTILIGRPIANTAIYILNIQNQLLPIGVVGEICISGVGLARGYLYKPELTDEKFVANPFHEGERMYKTGDLGRWLTDGTIEFIGRKDDQVKIRGYRIELGEIENALESHTAIDIAVVIAKTNLSDYKELVTYFVGKETLSTQDIRAYLNKILPGYMIPAHYVQLEKFPLTPNGKVDKKKLPDLDDFNMQKSDKQYVGPRNAIEEKLVEIWQEVLSKEAIGINEDFFALGGDSIKAIQIVSRLRQRGYSITIQDILLNPVIENLVEYVNTVNRLIDQSVIEGMIPLTPIQSYFFANNSFKHHFNQSVLLICKEIISVEGIKMILDKIVLHHDALRMVFREGSDGWLQENRNSKQSYSLEVIEEKDNESFIANCERIQSSMNLEEGPLFKVGLFQSSSTDRLFLVAHHLVIDGVSWRILFEDLTSLYQQYISGQALSLPLKTDSFKYWQERQIEYSGGEVLQEEECYWSSIESHLGTSLPLDYEKGTNLIKNASKVSFSLNEDLTNSLLTKCYKSFSTDVNDILITSLSIALREVLGIKKVLINLEGHGRENIGLDVDVSRTVGWFTSIYPVVIDTTHTTDVFQQLIQVKEVLHRIPNKGIGYGVLRYLTKKDYKLNPEITFNYLGDFGSGVKTTQGKSLFEFSGDYHGRSISEDAERDSILSVSGIVIDGQIRLSIEYSTKQFSRKTIQHLLNNYHLCLVDLIKLLSTREKRYLTPVDLTYNGLSVEELQELNNDFNIEDIYPTSDIQKVLIDEHEKDTSGVGIYHLLFCQSFVDESFSLPALESSISFIQRKHSVLRTTFFKRKDGSIYQCVKGTLENNLVIEDISFLSESQQRKYINASIESDISNKFKIDIKENQLTRFKVFILSEKSFELLFSCHHAIIDGWGKTVLQNELMELYLNFKKGIKLDNLQVVNSFQEHILLSEKMSKTKKANEFWQEELKNWEPFTLNKRIDSVENDYRSISTTIRGAVVEDLKIIAAKNKVSLRALFLKISIDAIQKTFNVSKFSLGVVFNGRTNELSEALNSIGLFWNILPFYVDIEKVVGYKDVQNKLNNCEEFSRFSALKIRDWVGSEPNCISFNFTHFHNLKDWKETNDELPLCVKETAMDKYHYPLNIHIGVNPFDENQITIKLDYNQAFFPENKIKILLRKYIN